jgi:membrane protease YdiL (CAAX protease family)
VARVKLYVWTSIVLALAVLQYAARFAEGSPDSDVLYQYETAIGSAFIYLVLLGIVLLIAGRRRDLLALRHPRSWSAALGLSLLLLVGIFIAVAALEQVLEGGKEQGLTPSGWQPEHAGAYAANFVVIAGLAPFVEELMYRGLGYSLLERFGRWAAIVLVGIAFAIDHGLLQAFPALFVFGCALAWLRLRTDSVYPGVILHSAFNGIALVAAVSI